METIGNIFITSYAIDIGIGLFSFISGFAALKTHKTKYYHWFANALLLSVFLKIVISYLNV
jgi:hypothetical protein